MEDSPGRCLTGPANRVGRLAAELVHVTPTDRAGLAAGALHFAQVHAERRDRVACLANLCQAVLATAEGRLAAAGEWVLNEKGLVERAGLAEIHDLLEQPGRSLPALVSEVQERLRPHDTVWVGPP